ncbi:MULTISPECIES: swarming motility protein SwrAA [Bacillus]|uniref:Swarming motility protein swrAA n=1 Tax=Bacillus amyloliquefaciens (strain ATCC 23350 / DSM 7 / BCRC 11601 / CCUG 28519 / NBRC 15535 / NRRL B-14393 / F) TaxID=692420 RepID=A0A9P1JK32_BACAS|nr:MULTISPECIES: swarming motility protein SwrAA [Bacillus amyloliquefaciens group]MBW8278886.1 Swarming motility protein SwrAA [Bacillus amyloliquefaciens]MCM3248213.1 Swarming motility protein SwrAA [Bacillus amyloliquefaciens]MCY7425756.1 Swarming motility protein SwrAA [Bacillus amyloliquefaciens]MCZ4247829.1 Swarming motility protein SwrAA [Bacillus amyloliquefaciens]MDH3088090.1 swarming motility protein SwrAA [Bacillus amyloliquefaciens]
MKRASIVREKKYYELVEQLKDRTKDVTFSSTKALSLLMLFSRYLVNYTNVESVHEINEECAKHYFTYLMKNHKRLGINLTDIKRSMLLISGVIEVEVDHYLKDFSLSNVTLWMTEER